MTATIDVGIWAGVGPPAPPPAAPPAPLPPNAAGQPPQPRRGFPWVWVIVGCGCLLLLLILAAAAGGLMYFGTRVQKEVQEIQREQPTQPQPPSTGAQEDGSSGAGATDGSGASDASPSSAVPSEEAAKARALQEVDEGWLAKVNKHSDDWATATVAVGPPASEWVAEIDLKWEDNGYVVVDSRAIEYP